MPKGTQVMTFRHMSYVNAREYGSRDHVDEMFSAASAIHPSTLDLGRNKLWNKTVQIYFVGTFAMGDMASSPV